MKIIIDAMGGDHAPRQIVLGALEAVKTRACDICLVGRGETILQVLKDNGVTDLPPRFEIVHASQTIEMDDNPSTAMRDKPDSSMAVGLRLLAEEKGDAFVSAGSTGALLAGATFVVKRIRGIRRAALAPIVPTAKGQALLVDCGANVECTAEGLLQFAYMGAYYASLILEKKQPQVGLLNIGAEESKGAPLQREAYRLLKKAGETGRIAFHGNIEGREAVLGDVDVIVSDGFSGNIYLKTMEGVGMFFIKLMKEMFTRNLVTKLSAAMVQNDLKAMKKLLDYTETGGAPLLGVSKPVIKAHGSSDAKAIVGAVRQAQKFVASGLIAAVTKDIELMKAPEGDVT